MAEFFASQIDFILFFYGLSFLLFSAVAFALGRYRRVDSWQMLGIFGLLHGITEWLDLAVLTIGDDSSFAAIRFLLLTASYLPLLEFARQEAIGYGLKLPGRWILAPFVLVALPAILHPDGLATAGILARYAIGFPGGVLAGAVFFYRARGFSGRLHWLAGAVGLGFVLYGVATGLVVPAAAFWPAMSVNQEAFSALTGVPIQLVRGLLACALALALWAIWGHVAGLESGSERYAAFLRRLYAWAVAALSVTLVLGWLLTQFLGSLYRADVETEAAGDIAVLTSRLTAESTAIDAMARALAVSPDIVAAIERPEAVESASNLLDRDAGAAQAQLGFLLDRSGRVVASGGLAPAPFDTQTIVGSATFRAALVGQAGHLIAYDAASQRVSLYVAAPVRGAGGAVIGAAILMRRLEQFETDLRRFDRPYFLIDPAGVIVLSNRHDLAFRPLWPVAPAALPLLESRFPGLSQPPLLAHEVTAGEWLSFEGKSALVLRAPAPGGWSLVMALPPEAHFASRALGIILTLLATVLALTFLFSQERVVHDSIEMERELQLQAIARDLRSQAYTDTLTGLYNRLRFDHGLAEEMHRAERYRTRLSLVVFDIDHFKRVNDTHGHQAGDRVLTRLARVAASTIRGTDLLARWGGEEFVLLTPACDLGMAAQAAEKLRAAIAAVEFEGIGRITCSFGVAEFRNGDSGQTLLARADEALYRAKANGRNRVERAEMNRAAE